MVDLAIPFVSEAYDRLRKAQNACVAGRPGMPGTIVSGADLRAARDALGMTQAGLADRLGMAGPVLSTMETGAKPIDPRTDLAVRFLLLEAGQ